MPCDLPQNRVGQCVNGVGFLLSGQMGLALARPCRINFTHGGTLDLPGPRSAMCIFNKISQAQAGQILSNLIVNSLWNYKTPSLVQISTNGIGSADSHL